ncbi:hypothetical protein LFL96_36355 (plasmid) [Paraburkholderia sp. D15]|uniref:hypothetical protein n=1 Tax=Paraburkholderia sp. D15 TaxID=2880218 RepID=UPI00247A39A3|nr:hypothetical protein [Paraburkholderia sp. D15]WGS54959.1 hypothetical protein LFL96_36355 [Paraburkholderia sp. D15]
MAYTTGAKSNWKSLFRSVLVIMTVSSGAALAAPDLMADEPARLSSDSSATPDVRAVSRRAVTATSLKSGAPGDPGLLYAQRHEVTAGEPADESLICASPEFRIQGNAFGAGSFALTALGFSTSRLAL